MTSEERKSWQVTQYFHPHPHPRPPHRRGSAPGERPPRAVVLFFSSIWMSLKEPPFGETQKIVLTFRKRMNWSSPGQ